MNQDRNTAETLPAPVNSGDSAAHVVSRTPLLAVRGLSVSFPAGNDRIRVVDDVSLDVGRGETVALVGESGCGKSVTSLSIMRLWPKNSATIDSGQALFHDPPDSCQPVDLFTASASSLRKMRGSRIAMIFQEPMTSLNPVYTVGEQIVEAMEVHGFARRRKARKRAITLLERVGIADAQRRVDEYPHQFSGGMRQRVMIAMALACEPVMLLADEPTTALDVTTQAKILELLQQLQEAFGLGILLVTHDLAAVAGAADRVYVMYAGRIVEHGPAKKILTDPLHPYTQGLLACSPGLVDMPARLPTIPGKLPPAAHYPQGCRFHPRCELAARVVQTNKDLPVTAPLESAVGPVPRRCVEGHTASGCTAPKLREVRPGRWVACWEV